MDINDSKEYLLDRFATRRNLLGTLGLPREGILKLRKRIYSVFFIVYRRVYATCDDDGVVKYLLSTVNVRLDLIAADETFLEGMAGFWPEAGTQPPALRSTLLSTSHLQLINLVVVVYSLAAKHFLFSDILLIQHPLSTSD